MNLSSDNSSAPAKGFTLIELLVAIAIIAILGGLIGTSYSLITQKARLSTELTAGRQLITAYHAYAAENNGDLIAGYLTKNPQATNKDGSIISGAAAFRYVWRLAPYVNYDMSGAMFVNDMRRKFPNPLAADLYQVSISPSFGINSYCLGGYTNGDYSLGLVKKAAQMAGGGDIIVFASAGRSSSGTLVAGNHEVTPPTALSKEWNSMNTSVPSSTGSVHFRHDSKAVAVHYGGHITLKSVDELRDMRRWNMAALQADDSSFPLPRYN